MCSVVHQGALVAVSCCGWVSPSPASTTAGPAMTSTRAHRMPALWHRWPRPTRLPPRRTAAPSGGLPTRQWTPPTGLTYRRGRRQAAQLGASIGLGGGAPAGSPSGRVVVVVGGQQHQRDLAAGLLLVAGVALVHLHKAGKQLAALGGIGGPGADGKALGADLDLGPAGRTQVVVPARMPRGAAVGGTQHEALP